MTEKNNLDVMVAQIATDVKHMTRTMDKHLEEFSTWKRNVDTHMSDYERKKAEVRGIWGTICIITVFVGAMFTAFLSEIKTAFFGTR